MRAECYFCHTKTIQELIKKFRPDKKIAEDFIFSIHKLLGENRDMINPKLATEIHRIARDKLNNQDLYASEKDLANKTLLDDHVFWQSFIDNSENPFSTAVKLAVVGNIIDYGAHSLNGDLIEQITSLFSIPLKLDRTMELNTAINTAHSILYLGDNAGEVFFDRLLIEKINHPDLTYVTRGKPVINDITIDDALQVGIDNVCKLISNGYDAPSTLLEYCSDEFIEAYNSADLIISKGQGNFEGLMNENHPNTYFLLIAKCQPMAELLNVDKNDLLVTKLN